MIQRDVGHHVAYTTREVGQYLVVEASVGVIVIWDKKTTVFIKLAPSYKVRSLPRPRPPGPPLAHGPLPSPGRRVSAGHGVRPVRELRPAIQQRLHHPRPHGGGQRAGLW